MGWLLFTEKSHTSFVYPSVPTMINISDHTPLSTLRTDKFTVVSSVSQFLCFHVPIILSLTPFYTLFLFFLLDISITKFFLRFFLIGLTFSITFYNINSMVY